MGSTGDLLVGFGFTQKEALKLSKEVNELAVDLASFTNVEGGAVRASEALTRALLGERESIKSLGKAVNENTEQFKDAVKQIRKTRDVTLFQAKALATLQLIVKQSKKAIGDFARTSDKLAGQQKILSQRFVDLQVIIGKQLNPTMTKLTQIALKVVKVTTEWAKENKAAISKAFKDGIVFILDSFNLLVKVVQGLSQTFLSAKVIFNIFGAFVVTKIADMVNAFTTVRDVVKKIFFKVAETIVGSLRKVLRFAGTIADKFEGPLGRTLNDLADGALTFEGAMRQAGKAIKTGEISEVEKDLRFLAIGFAKTGNEALDQIIAIEDFSNKILRLSEKLKDVVIKPTIEFDHEGVVRAIEGLVDRVKPGLSSGILASLKLSLQPDVTGISEVDKKIQVQEAITAAQEVETAKRKIISQQEADDAVIIQGTFLSDFLGMTIGANKQVFNEDLSLGKRTEIAKKDLFVSLGKLAASQAGKDFETQKKFNIAGAIASTFAGAAKALDLPWPLNLIAFASVVATGLAAVNTIRSTKPGSSAAGGGGDARPR